MSFMGLTFQLINLYIILILSTYMNNKHVNYFGNEENLRDCVLLLFKVMVNKQTNLGKTLKFKPQRDLQLTHGLSLVAFIYSKRHVFSTISDGKRINQQCH